MQMHDIEKSSNIAEYGYDEVNKELRVRFRSGALYSYSDVEPEHVAKLRDADSPGAYFLAHIRDKYPYKRLSERDESN